MAKKKKLEDELKWTDHIQAGFHAQTGTDDSGRTTYPRAEFMQRRAEERREERLEMERRQKEAAKKKKS